MESQEQIRGGGREGKGGGEVEAKESQPEDLFRKR